MKTIQSLLSIVVILFISVFIISQAYGWLYPEHRDITVLAIQNLDARYRALLDDLWKEARTGYESRLSESVIGTTADIMDYASWPAIAGDHSCSAENMLNTILKTDWILEVSEIAAGLKTDLAEADNRSRRINAIRDSDIKFQKADREYATRAESNNEHFLLARTDVSMDSKAYSKLSLSEGSELNAIGAYSWYHLSALEKASLLNRTDLDQQQRTQIALYVLADEAFALHFLQDVFAAGHVAGSWGDASQRKGTHDYYNEHGLEVSTWDGRRLVLMGDAYLQSDGAQIAAEPVRQSLEQVLDVLSGAVKIEDKQRNRRSPDNFNVCQSSYWPARDFDPVFKSLLIKILVMTPVPGLATGQGSLPRFRSELGPFVGIVPAVRGLGFNRDFGSLDDQPLGIGAIEMALRLGMGLEGVLNQSGDGLLFLDIGTRVDGSSTNNANTVQDKLRSGFSGSAIPSRTSYYLRVRIPFWLIPFDLLISAPVLLIADPDLYTQMAVQSANGGLIPWQAGIATPVGRFQFILGREIGISFYGLGRNKDVLQLRGKNNENTLIQYQSTQFDFPIVEYRPFRIFSTDQSSSLAVQLSFGFDYPHSQVLILPEDSEMPKLQTIWYLGLRMDFDWRYYW